MADGEGWVLRPVLRGLCKFESLRDGSLGLLDLWLMNEAMDVEQENAARAAAAAKAKE